VDISNRDYGVTWLTPDAPLVEVGDITANLIGGLGDPRLWLDRVEPSQTVYSWAMNNHWHTNYRAEQEGSTVFRYFIWPHPGGVSDDRAARFALECSQPLLVLPARGVEPKPGPVQVHGTGVQVTAFKPSDDGKGWIVRLFGYSDKPETVALKWDAPAPATVWWSDNSERPLRRLEGTFEVPAQTLLTLRAEFPK
jgi:alpha-mannosidase